MTIFKTNLWSHQKQMVDFTLKCFQEFGYCLWIAGMATGKTATSLKVRHEIEAKRTLVFSTKASIETTWPKQVAVHTEGVNCLSLTEYMMLPDKKGIMKRTKVTVPMKAKLLVAAFNSDIENLVVCVNYESAKDMAETIGKLPFNLVIADECHKLKSHGSKTLKVLAKACMNIPAKIGMTGTAFNDRPIDVFGQVAFLTPEFYRGHLASTLFGRWNDFFDAYVNYFVANGIKIPKKDKPYKNQDKLLEVINPFTFFIETEDAVDLPPVQYVLHTVKPSKTLRTAYDEMARDMVTQLGDKLAVADTVLTQSLRLAQMTGGYATPYHLDAAGNYVQGGGVYEIPDSDCKLQKVIDIVDEAGKNKVVIFTRFTQDVIRIKSKLIELGYNVKELTGRLHEQEAFQNGDGDVLVANMSAGSTSVTLTIATVVIDFSLGHSRTDYDQSRYRCRRPDSDLKKPIIYHQIVMEDSIDEDILDALKGKGDVADMLRAGLINKVV